VAGELAFAFYGVGNRHIHGQDWVDGLCCVEESAVTTALRLSRYAAEVLVRAGCEVARTLVQIGGVLAGECYGTY
jgi:hypothetical protein